MEVQRVIQVDGMACGRVDGVREEKMGKNEKKEISIFTFGKE